MKYFSQPLSLLKDIYNQRHIISNLVLQDFRNRCLGSALGFVWTFVEQLVTVIIFWFVISIVFGAREINGMPFLPWFICGMAAWSFFSESLTLTTSVYHEYSFLVKKVNFQLSVLPLVKILSSLYVHLIFLAAVLVVLFLMQVPFSVYFFQLVYYIFALIVFLQAISWITASLFCFIRDLAYVVGILLQFGFWLTPVFWDPAMLPERFQQWTWLIKLNPVYYIVDGYRQSLVFNQPFWQDWQWTVYFWAVTLLLFFTGAVVFKKLKPQFADVL
jgi:ABC-type polysaccharide/polyol phosphate export permease